MHTPVCVSIHMYLTFSSQGLEKPKMKIKKHREDLVWSWKRMYFTQTCLRVSTCTYAGTRTHTCTSTVTQACVLAVADSSMTSARPRHRTVTAQGV